MRLDTCCIFISASDSYASYYHEFFLIDIRSLESLFSFPYAFINQNSFCLIHAYILLSLFFGGLGSYENLCQFLSCKIINENKSRVCLDNMSIIHLYKWIEDTH